MASNLTGVNLGNPPDDARYREAVEAYITALSKELLGGNPRRRIVTIAAEYMHDVKLSESCILRQKAHSVRKR
jgi:hypothetical protein